MDNTIKTHTKCNIPTIEGYIGNNMVLSMEENLTSSDECIPMEVQDNRISNMITYHVINKLETNATKQEYDYLQGNTFSININNCKYIQTNKKITTKTKQRISTKRNCHRTIAPKIGDMHITKAGKNVCLDPKKRKDDKRRATHNEIERRRRNNINNCILKLKGLIPEMETANLSSEVDGESRSTHSKSQVLIRAYEYIQHMQEELKSLRECIKENDQLRLSNQELHHKINQLQNHVS